MKLAYTFLGIMLVGFCFELIQFDTKPYFLFPFYPIAITWSTYIWMLLEKVILIWLVLTIITLCREFDQPYTAVVIFLAIQIGDLIDWALTYNTPYWIIDTSMGEIPISFNIISFVLYLSYVLWYGSTHFSDSDTSKYGRSNGHY